MAYGVYDMVSGLGLCLYFVVFAGAFFLGVGLFFLSGSVVMWWVHLGHANFGDEVVVDVGTLS